MCLWSNTTRRELHVQKRYPTRRRSDSVQLYPHSAAIISMCGTRMSCNNYMYPQPCFYLLLSLQNTHKKRIMALAALLNPVLSLMGHRAVPRWEEHLPSLCNVTFVQIGANCGGPCPARQHNKLAKAKIPFGITLGALGGAVLR